MSTYKRILVAAQPEKENQTALKRAIFLAKKINAELVLASCIYDTSYDVASVLTSKERDDMKQAFLKAELNRLNNLAALYTDIKNITCEVIWNSKLYKGIIKIAEQQNCDLIVKGTKKHSKIMQKLFTPNDWHLLRNSPVNVLMVKEHEWAINGNIVTAISLEDHDETHTCLSEQVSKESKELASLLNADMHLINTFTGPPVHISIEMPQFSAQKYNDNVMEQRKLKMKDLAEKVQVPSSHQHIVMGLAEDAVPQLCKQLDAELLVLGSVGRTGLSAALLGNTAEHIIDKIDCDTLVIKPQA